MLERLEERTVPSLTIGAMGDSMTAPYGGGLAPNLNWVQQFQALKSSLITVDDFAVGGATSTTLLQQGQDTAVASLVASGQVTSAFLMIGANDISGDLSDVFAGNYSSLVATLVANVETAINTVAAAGKVNLVVANVPDVGTTPLFRAQYGNNPAGLANVTAATTQANQGIQAFATSKGIPVMDMFDLSYLPLSGPVTVDGVVIPTASFYCGDGFHPSTISQGIMANLILQCFHDAYGTPIVASRLTDQQIFTDAGLSPPPGTTYFDMSPYVIYPPLATRRVSAGAMGDDVTAPYAGQPYGSAGDRSWVEQFRAVEPTSVILYDKAVVGATAATVVSGGQATTVAGLVSTHKVAATTLIVGSNDVFNNLTTIFAGNFAPLVSAVVPNVESAIKTVAAAGKVPQAIGNIPDVGVTPYFRSQITSDPTLLADVTSAVTQANQQIQAFAAVRGIPVIDLFGLSHLTVNPITMGGVQTSAFYAPDGLHPSTVLQGLLADSILQAFYAGYGTNIAAYRLSDQQILTEAHITFPPGTSYFDITPYVMVKPPAGAVASIELPAASLTGAVPPAVSLASVAAPERRDRGSDDRSLWGALQAGWALVFSSNQADTSRFVPTPVLPVGLMDGFFAGDDMGNQVLQLLPRGIEDR
jgi:lysophospholipase L1-like esterase